MSDYSPIKWNGVYAVTAVKVEPEPVKVSGARLRKTPRSRKGMREWQCEYWTGHGGQVVLNFYCGGDRVDAWEEAVLAAKHDYHAVIPVRKSDGAVEHRRFIPEIPASSRRKSGAK